MDFHIHVYNWNQSIAKVLICDRADVSAGEQFEKQRLHNAEAIAEEKDKFDYQIILIL